MASEYHCGLLTRPLDDDPHAAPGPPLCTAYATTPGPAPGRRRLVDVVSAAARCAAAGHLRPELDLLPAQLGHQHGLPDHGTAFGPALATRPGRQALAPCRRRYDRVPLDDSLPGAGIRPILR